MLSSVAERPTLTLTEIGFARAVQVEFGFRKGRPCRLCGAKDLPVAAFPAYGSDVCGTCQQGGGR